MSSEGHSEASAGSSEPGLPRAKFSNHLYHDTEEKFPLLSSASRIRSPGLAAWKESPQSPGQQDVIYDTYVSLAPAHKSSLPGRKRRIPSSHLAREPLSSPLKRRKTAPPATNSDSAQWNSESLLGDEDNRPSSARYADDEQSPSPSRPLSTYKRRIRLLPSKGYYSDQYRHLLNQEITRAANPFADFDIRGLKPSRIGATTWSAAEKAAFFKALELKGRRNLPEIVKIVNLVKQQQDFEEYSDSDSTTPPSESNGQRVPPQNISLNVRDESTGGQDDYASGQSTDEHSTHPDIGLNNTGKGKRKERSREGDGSNVDGRDSELGDTIKDGGNQRGIEKDRSRLNSWVHQLQQHTGTEKDANQGNETRTDEEHSYDADTEGYWATYPATDVSSSDESWKLYNDGVGEATGKNPFECESYAQFLESWLRTVHVDPLADDLKPLWEEVDDILLPYRDLPAAFEMNGIAEDALDRAAESLQVRVWHKERKDEIKKYGDVAVLTSDIAAEIEGLMPSENARMRAEMNEEEVGEDGVLGAASWARGEYWLPQTLEQAKSYAQEGRTLLDKIPAARVLNLQRFLELSRNVFMNPRREIEICNWREVAQGDEEPSILYSAFEDFSRVVLMITKRVVQAAIYRARERIAQFRPADTKSYKPCIRKEDVWDALDLVGMDAKRDWQDKYRNKYWLNLPRRCGLVVYWRTADMHSKSLSKPLTDDQVAVALRSTRKRIPDPRLDYRNQLPKKKRRSSRVRRRDTPDHYTEFIVPGTIQRLHDLYPDENDVRVHPAAPSGAPPAPQYGFSGPPFLPGDPDPDTMSDIEETHASEPSDMNSDTQANIHDNEESHREQQHLLELLQIRPELHPSPQEFHPPSEPIITEKTEEDFRLDDWYHRTAYKAEWERRWRGRRLGSTSDTGPSVHERDTSEERGLRRRNKAAELSSAPSTPSGWARSASSTVVTPRRRRRRVSTSVTEERVLPSIEQGSGDLNSDSDESMLEATSQVVTPRSLSRRGARERATSAISSTYEAYPEDDSNPSGSGDDFIDD
ncbi:hypothetical protein P152DRAFT_515049 [Eremomyces bilateralis CBS 781.70]|uniref:Myb-like domain-containing protein n=1 Tax=Eremomyces bilateralis CBS 781.70 TaxID=1392243 RepID=A0A6G1G058_9PEZI|nr:uncharacterized protein P152DRAFT_515049 [Eremomyces bilateralis CBS 781.70]KAF1811497.1 hypothetical protein P152DRAFT_515049 [Eremomyces bilateralis CBS 781.70]